MFEKPAKFVVRVIFLAFRFISSMHQKKYKLKNPAKLVVCGVLFAENFFNIFQNFCVKNIVLVVLAKQLIVECQTNSTFTHRPGSMLLLTQVWFLLEDWGIQR